jgi:hypothetical protein
MFGPCRSFKRICRGQIVELGGQPKNYISEHVATAENDIDAVYCDTTAVANESGSRTDPGAALNLELLPGLPAASGEMIDLAAICRCMSSVLAHLRHANGHEECLLFGVDRSAPGDRQGVDGASPSR